MKGAEFVEVTSTEMQNNFGAYLKYSQYEDVHITRNGKIVAVLRGLDELQFSEEAKIYGEKKDRLTLEEFFDFAARSNEQCEFIDGEVIIMASPSFQHQNCVLEMATMFREWASGGTCRAVVAPFDVLLQASDTINVVQPDVVVICDQENVDAEGRYRGIPSLVVEVLSESNRGHDLIKKLEVYRIGGIKEYWIVNPTRGEILTYTFTDYEVQDYQIYGEGSKLSSTACPGLIVSVDEVFL